MVLRVSKLHLVIQEGLNQIKRLKFHQIFLKVINKEIKLIISQE